MRSRVGGSSAPNGSSMRMMRGLEDQRARDRDALAHAARELVRILVARRLSTSSPTLPIHSRARVAALGRRHAAALESERDVVLDRAVVERRVVLKDHAAVGAGRRDRFAADEHRPGRRGMLRREARDQSEHGRLAAARRPEDRHELHPVRQVLARRTMTSLIAVKPLSYVFVTLSNTHDRRRAAAVAGAAAADVDAGVGAAEDSSATVSSLVLAAVREEPALEPVAAAGRSRTRAGRSR